jgi:hypothetical protein
MIEIFTRLIPEAFLLVLSAHVFTKTALDKKKYILSSILFGISNYIIRSLPIDYGIHIVLGFIIFAVIITYIVGINPLKSIQVVFISTILIMLSEVINVGIINYVFRGNENKIGTCTFNRTGHRRALYI